MPKKLTVFEVSRLRKLFEAKSWDRYYNEATVFENFCELLDNLNDEQRELMYELAGDYLWLGSSEYELRFNTILENLNQTILRSAKKVWIMPLLKPSDRNKTKSSKNCAYLIKSMFSINRNYAHMETAIFDDFKKLKRYKFTRGDGEIILLVDDFVGTGDTFEVAWRDLTRNDTITNRNTILVSLVFQQEGLDYIRAKYNMEV